MSNVSSSIPVAMPPELAREIARQGDVRLSALTTLATAADLRATTLCGIFGAGAIGLTAAVLAVLISEHVAVSLVVGGSIAAFGLYVAAIIAAFAGSPCDFFVGGGNPDDLRSWSWADGHWRTEIEMLESSAVRYADSIKTNAGVLVRSARLVSIALAIGLASPVLGTAASIASQYGCLR